MSTEKMREEFEAWYLRRFGKCDLKSSWAMERWEAWQASRAAIEVELPEQRNVPDRDCWARTNALGYNTANHECRTSIESLGLKVKP